MSAKKNTVNIDNVKTSGTLRLSNGYLFLGDTDNYHESLPPQSYMGTSETKGNYSRDLYNINTNGPILFGYTPDDKKKIIQKFTDNVSQNTILASYPWLYPVQESWTQDTQISMDSSEKFPIYKCLGKGLGEIEFFKVASPLQGTEEKSGNTVTYNVNGITCGNHPKNGVMYPFDGKIYAGTLVEVVTETDPVTNIKETKVIPYQKGRGIPMYSQYYKPENTTGTTDYAPFGELQWPSTTNTMSPSLATGVEPGDSNRCIGIALDTFTSTIPDERLFKYSEPSNAPDTHDPWYNHPAPYTVPAVSTSQGFVSPGPNLSGTFWAPWPEYYAYSTDQPIPILTKGITTARIGAAYNIALRSYGIKKKISATDETWVPIDTIPLFQGERLEAGSYVYASVKGHCITPGPYLENYFTEGSATDTSSKGYLGQTPWDYFVDSTWGNIGWTGTPGLSFNTIPDSGVGIPEVLKNQNGVAKAIPFLNQSNQGSIIVHPVSTIQPTPALGNAYLQRQNRNSIENLSEEEKYTIFKDRFNINGVSGRCMLAQTAPEKCQPIGVLLETIEGKGKWEYNSLLKEFPSTLVASLTNGGVSYPNPVTIPVRGGTGSNMEVTWTEYLQSSPFLGTINQIPTITAPGIGYVNGDIVTVQDNTLQYNLTPQYKGNNASFVFDGVELQYIQGGSGYTGAQGTTFNSSRNNIYLIFSTVGTGITFYGSGIAGSTHFQDFLRYPAGTTIRILDDNVLEQNQAIYNVNSVSYISGSLDSIYLGDTYPLKANYVYEHNVVNWNFRNPIVSLTVTSGSVTEVTILDYGAGNAKGDLIVLSDPGSDRNAVWSFPGIANGIQEITHAFPWYTSDQLILPTYRAGSLTDDGLIIDIKQSDPLRQTDYNEYVAIVATINTLGAAVLNTVYEVYVPPPGGYQYVPSPWYTSRHFSLWYTPSGELKVHAGGSNYTDATGVKTYNLTANSLRLSYTVTDGLVTAKVANDPLSLNWDYIHSRYTFDSVTGTELRLLDDVVPEEYQDIVKLVNSNNHTNIETSFVKQGGYYSDLNNGNWFFQTQRSDQTNPTVTIKTRDGTSVPAPTGTVSEIILESAGTGNQTGDLILVTQSGSDNNCIFIYNDNRNVINLPPFATSNVYKVDSSEEAWTNYSNVMSSVTNLLDKQVLMELRPTGSNTMENPMPNGVVNWINIPSTNNLYENFY